MNRRLHPYCSAQHPSYCTALYCTSLATLYSSVWHSSDHVAFPLKVAALTGVTEEQKTALLRQHKEDLERLGATMDTERARQVPTIQIIYNVSPIETFLHLKCKLFRTLC
jgi:hypothetical protein